MIAASRVAPLVRAGVKGQQLVRGAASIVRNNPRAVSLAVQGFRAAGRVLTKAAKRRLRRKTAGTRSVQGPRDNPTALPMTIFRPPVTVGNVVTAPVHQHLQSYESVQHGTVVVLSGRQLFCNVKESSASATTLEANGGATVDSGYAASILPITSGGRLAVMAGVFTRYRWRSLRFEYAPSAASTNQGQFALGVTTREHASEGGLKTWTYAEVSSLANSVSAQYFTPFTIDFDMSYDEHWYQTRRVGGMSADIDILPCLLAANLYPGGTTAVRGVLFFEYVIELRDPCATSVLSVGGTDNESCRLRSLLDKRVATSLRVIHADKKTITVEIDAPLTYATALLSCNGGCPFCSICGLCPHHDKPNGCAHDTN